MIKKVDSTGSINIHIDGNGNQGNIKLIDNTIKTLSFYPNGSYAVLFQTSNHGKLSVNQITGNTLSSDTTYGLQNLTKSGEIILRNFSDNTIFGNVYGLYNRTDSGGDPGTITLLNVFNNSINSNNAGMYNAAFSGEIKYCQTKTNLTSNNSISSLIETGPITYGSTSGLCST